MSVPLPWLVACLAFLAALPAWAAEGFIPHLELDARLDPGRRTLSADAMLAFAGTSLAFPWAPGLTLHRLELDGRPLPPPSVRNGALHLSAPGPGPHRLKLSYAGALAPLPALDHRQVLGGMAPMADESGSFLPAGSGWYPDPGIPFSYRVKLSLPPGQKGLVAGTLVREYEVAPSARKGKGSKPAPPAGGSYHAEYLFAQAAEGIDLMAGPYVVGERLVPRQGQAPLRLRTWFHADLADLAPGYLDDSARYIERYGKLIGPYPFDAFSVVASPLPTGFGMPTLTYLGRDVLRLPFIRATSLGHEVLHNWWGNGVIPDWATGNWSEGLTSFMADYAYKEDQSEDAAREARLTWLRNLAAVPEGEDTPLTAFTARHHGISSIVGYDKAAMVFFMLRDEIGGDAFQQGLRLFWQRHRFRRAGWHDLEKAFSETSGRDLGPFFQQWVERPGAPRLKLADARWAPGNLAITLEQTPPAYGLQVPLRLLAYPDQTKTRRVDLKDTGTRFNLSAPELVQAVDLDPDYRLWRRVDGDRFPPTLREIFVSPRVGLLLADRGGDGNDAMTQAATALAQRLLDGPPVPLAPTGESLPGRDPALIMGSSDAVAGMLARLGLPPATPQVAGKGSARVWTGHDAEGRPYMVVVAADAQAMAALARPLPHYGRQSWLVFEGARAVDRGIWPALPERIRVDVMARPGAAPALVPGTGKARP